MGGQLARVCRNQPANWPVDGEILFGVRLRYECVSKRIALFHFLWYTMRMAMPRRGKKVSTTTSIRLNLQELKDLKKAAKTAGVALSTFVRDAAIGRSKGKK